MEGLLFKAVDWILEKLGIKSGRRTELRGTIRSSLIEAEKLIPSMGYPSLIKPAIAALANDSALLPKRDKAVVGPAIEALENLRNQVIGAYTGGERPEVLAAEAKARDETRAVVVKAIGYDFQRMTAATLSAASRSLPSVMSAVSVE